MRMQWLLLLQLLLANNFPLVLRYIPIPHKVKTYYQESTFTM